MVSFILLWAALFVLVCLVPVERLTVEVRFTPLLVLVFGFDFEVEVLAARGKIIKGLYCAAVIFSLSLLSRKLSRTWPRTRSLGISVYFWIW